MKVEIKTASPVYDNDIKVSHPKAVTMKAKQGKYYKFPFYFNVETGFQELRVLIYASTLVNARRQLKKKYPNYKILPQ